MDPQRSPSLTSTSPARKWTSRATSTNLHSAPFGSTSNKSLWRMHDGSTKSAIFCCDSGSRSSMMARSSNAVRWLKYVR